MITIPFRQQQYITRLFFAVVLGSLETRLATIGDCASPQITYTHVDWNICNTRRLSESGDNHLIMIITDDHQEC